MKVLYILGTQRGGTTIVGRVLGLLPGVAYAGEVRRLWEFGVGPDRSCGCGEPLSRCPVWSVVLDRVRAADIDPGDVPTWQRQVAPVRRSWQSTTNRQRQRDRRGPAFSRYMEAMDATYLALSEAYHAPVVIDNSKLPLDGAYLRDMPDVVAYYLHVVRDSRGVLASQMRRRSPASPVRRSLDATGLAAGWVLRHARSGEVTAATGAGTFLRVRYEDFVADPDATASAVCGLLGLPAPAKHDGAFQLPLVHTPRGPNPALTTTLVEDTSWRTELSSVERGIITGLTSPWLLRDGYLRRRGGAVSTAPRPR